jgi:hypothetical protein
VREYRLRLSDENVPMKRHCLDVETRNDRKEDEGLHRYSSPDHETEVRKRIQSRKRQVGIEIIPQR